MNAPTRNLKAKIWERDAFDWYVEEQRASRALFTVERFVGHIWDPACGQGNIVVSAIEAGYDAHGTDVVNRAFRHWYRGEHDFLSWHSQPLAQNIVVNPPFFRAKGAEAFIRQALALAVGKVAVFVDICFLAGDGRAQGLFAEFPPNRIYSISPRINCPPGEYLAAGNTAKNGTADWIWAVFDKTAPHTGTTFHWLRAEK